MRRFAALTHTRLVDMMRRTRFAAQMSARLPPACAIRLTQEIMPSETVAAKRHNLRRAASLIDGTLIRPGELFSFWRLIGNPTARRNFAFSRTLVAGKITDAEGGGLCQISGIIYEAALRLGLEIRERHSHSVDIYAEHERFTPLGLDAAVVYGYKDLRFVNTSQHTLALGFELDNDSISLIIRSDSFSDYAKPTVEVERSPDCGEFRQVTVTVAGNRIVSRYRIRQKESDAQ